MIEADVIDNAAKSHQAYFNGDDKLEAAIRSFDDPIKRNAGASAFHYLALGSIGASIYFFCTGRKDLALFIGLWPPTFLALKAAAENVPAAPRRYYE